MSLPVNEVYKTIKPYFEVFYRAQVEGIKEYNRLPADSLAKLTIRSARSDIHDFAVDYASKELEGDPRVHISHHSQLVLYTIDGGVSVRIKKLGDDFHSSNIETQQVIDFGYQYELPGLPDTVHLEAGYVPDATGTQAAGFYVVWPDGKGIVKVWNLLEELGIKADNVVRLEFEDKTKRPRFMSDKGKLPKRLKDNKDDDDTKGS